MAFCIKRRPFCPMCGSSPMCPSPTIRILFSTSDSVLNGPSYSSSFTSSPSAPSSCSAAISFFGDVETIPYRTFNDVFQAVLSDEVEFGVIPVENSQAGSINETYDLLLNYPVVIFGEVNVRINHFLVALPGETLESITNVHSHPQALAQCQEFISKLNVQIFPGYNTAGSAKRIREEAIKGAADLPG